MSTYGKASPSSPKRNRSETRAARLVQDVTGVAYSTCLRKIRGMTWGEREAYLDKIEAVPERSFGTKDSPLCLKCLVMLNIFHTCP